MKKRLLALLLMCLLFVSASCVRDTNDFSSNSSNNSDNDDHHSEETVTEPNEPLTYQTLDDGTLGVKAGSKAGIETIEIPATYDGKTVSKVLSCAFENATSLKSVTLPVGITGIEESAFSGCTNLESITIPETVKEIGDFAFSGCKRLVSIILPESLTEIGASAFSLCSNLENVMIPNSVISFGEDAFIYCKSLKYNEYHNAYYLGNTNNPYFVLIQAKAIDITECGINTKTKFIASKAFSRCTYLSSVTIPDSVTSIGVSSFEYCPNLASLTIPNSVAEIGDSAFFFCTGLVSVTIPDSVTSIGDEAFRYCENLTNVTIGNGVANIGSGAFQSCMNLNSITLGSNIRRIGVDAFEVGTNNIYNEYNNAYYVGNSDNPYMALVKVKSTNITSCNIHSKTKMIALEVFSNCENLASIIVESGNTVYHVTQNCLIETATKTLVVGCQTSVIPTDGSVTSIGEYAFYKCGRLKGIAIPDSVTSIGDFAFLSCTGLLSITLGNGLTSIGNWAFHSCDSR